jgi:hypothetical protein
VIPITSAMQMPAHAKTNIYVHVRRASALRPPADCNSRMIVPRRRRIRAAVNASTAPGLYHVKCRGSIHGLRPCTTVERSRSGPVAKISARLAEPAGLPSGYPENSSGTAPVQTIWLMLCPPGGGGGVPSRSVEGLTVLCSVRQENTPSAYSSLTATVPLCTGVVVWDSGQQHGVGAPRWVRKNILRGT